MESLRLTSLSWEELNALLAEWGERPFRAKQIWSWLYVKLARSLEEMSDVSAALRARLSAVALPLMPQPLAHQIAADGTEKWLLALLDGAQIETVYIPDVDRGTLCVSSQVGCTLSCSFCHTGTQRLLRNLQAGEIVEQVTFARAELAARGLKVTNVVLMGMGEPLYNYDAVVKAVRILLNGSGLAIGTRKITLSTAGVVPKLVQVGWDLGINMAISLHSVRDAVRDQLIPLNRKHNLAALQEAIRAFPLKHGRAITWEYLLLKGVNDSLQDARELVQFIGDIPSKVNLITFNPWPGCPYEPTSRENTLRFQEIICQAKIVTVIRDSRGADIAAACGQLRSECGGGVREVVAGR
ncbi:MAG: 23S rRNA (adenine(2503)-C(2))-methyltransferase RlmN [Magnetococcales bacterium]|nr:23S rRNA (adenine(2503)-C(2))-methyltransferase RlmN [Magnetococcales bacterium]